MRGRDRSIGRLVAASVLALLAATGSRAGEKPPRNANVNRAEASFALGRFDDADAVAAAVLEGEPENFRALHLRGRIALLENRLADAEDLLQRALAVTPTHRETRALLAEAYYRQDRFAEAAPILEAIAEEAKASKLAAFAERQPYLKPDKSVVLPFLQTDPLPVVELSINGSEPAAFILDTGAAELILDREWATEDLGIEIVGTTRGTFGGDLTANVDHGFVGAVGLGGLTVRNVPVQMLDTSPFSRVAPGREIRGVLGTVFLYHFLSTIDYPGARLVLEPRRSTDEDDEPVEGTVRIPFWMAGDHLILARGKVNDADPLLFLVDTGLAGAAFTCPKTTLAEAGVELVQPPSSGIGGGGEVAVVPFLLEKLSLGGLERSQMPGLFGPFPDSLGQGKGFRIGGLISHAFFRPYAVTFDFDAMEIVVTGVE